MFYYQNIENGNVFDFTHDGMEDMIAEAAELYDIGDPTNPTMLSEKYIVIEVEG